MHPPPQANVVCVVYDVSEEATIEKVSKRVPVHPGSLLLTPSLVISLSLWPGSHSFPREPPVAL